MASAPLFLLALLAVTATAASAADGGLPDSGSPCDSSSLEEDISQHCGGAKPLLEKITRHCCGNQALMRMVGVAAGIDIRGACDDRDTACSGGLPPAGGCSVPDFSGCQEALDSVRCFCFLSRLNRDGAFPGDRSACVASMLGVRRLRVFDGRLCTGSFN